MNINDIKVTLTTSPMDKPTDEGSLGFGMVFTDHMFTMEYTAGRGWHDPEIVPFGPVSISPSASVFHYGQEIFEGLKAYRGEDGAIRLFRPEENFIRMNESAERLCMPTVPVDFAVAALKKLVEIDKDWVPHAKDTSLYIRPVQFATDPQLKVKASTSYKYYILLSPSGAYYASGLKPVRIWVEGDYVRAVRGGIGQAKTGGNYASSLIAQSQVAQKGYDQVLWLDGVERRYIEEMGAMNVFFVIDGVVVTPQLNGSILPGITRKSVVEVLRGAGHKVEERQISIDEVAAAHAKGTLTECFSTGTAAVISPVGSLTYQGQEMVIGGNKIGATAQWLYDQVTGIQWGRIPGPEGWSVKVCD